MNIIKETGKFKTWLSGLKDQRARSRIVVRIARAKQGNFGDCEPVGDGVSEMRITYGPGYRIYYAREGGVSFLLLCGGDKSSQVRDIQAAKEMWQQLKKK
ncbi:type II toxin-antitoxin system RelE/ParE family toxin [Herbaspirillum rubrisubalbicans]|uniref:type II toxin-antitoxin system RelE/ParE family toxin n=1 Tax=Herbaspirillum rubrisubalbicans TaxID=80842 RepID=UPI0020A0766E|nr:type II toxin-antitoxin system RelE/ParE family toxin [Herbaspirillum rubrisubalbicans]MCP1574722.1 putative addiction module killer protein [Herbaspirillum rubrisubalbicans]